VAVIIGLKSSVVISNWGGRMKGLILVSVFVVFAFANERIDNLVKEAKSGNAEAISKLAYSFENGIGVKKDLLKARKFYQKAAKMGDSDAKLALTLIELESKVSKSVNLTNSVTLEDREFLFNDLSKEDVQELIKKAKNSDKSALFSLGVLYENGYGIIAQDKKRAIALYKKAYKLGSKKAENILRLQGALAK